MHDDAAKPVEFSTRVAHPARLFDYWMGGKDNFPADRELGDKLAAVAPEMPVDARAHRDFLNRAVRLLATSGLHQFVHLGTGMPANATTHQVAREVVPDAHVVVVYVEDEPISLAHARALLEGDGPTHVVPGSLQYARRTIEDPRLRDLIDFTKPVVVMLNALPSFIPDAAAAADFVACFSDAIPPGSYVVMAHLTDTDRVAAAEIRRVWTGVHAMLPPTMRGYDEIRRLFDGLELIEPGLVPVHQWRPDEPVATDRKFWSYGGVAVKN